MIKKWTLSEFGPPNASGVYSIYSVNYYTHERKLLYIGSSKNISKRILNPNHPYRQLINECQFPVLICSKFKECTDFIELEKRLIKRLRPKYNLQHSGIEYRSKFIQL